MPTPDERTLHECRWEPATELTIPADWPSGVYLGRLTTLPPKDERPYWQSYVIFIVRDERPADVLFQCSDNTWQAYNGWPYKSSVYTHPKGGQGPWADVSFDRPYGREAQYSAIVNDPLSVGSGAWLTFEFPLAYWLEQQGCDVSYCSNSDMIAPDRGLKCKAFLSVGHDEYWDIRQYESVVKMRDAGVNLLFLSGNAVCWVSPFKPSSDGRANRIIFRGGPYGGSQPMDGAPPERARPVPRTRAGRRLPDRRPEPSDRQRRRRLDLREARALDVRRHGHETRRQRAGADRLGVPRRPARGPARFGNRRPRHGLAGRRESFAVDGHDLSRPQGELRVQRRHDFLGAGPEHAAGPHAPLVALEPAPRPGPARATNDPEPAAAGGLPALIDAVHANARGCQLAGRSGTLTDGWDARDVAAAAMAAVKKSE